VWEGGVTWSRHLCNNLLCRWSTILRGGGTLLVSKSDEGDVERRRLNLNKNTSKSTYSKRDDIRHLPTLIILFTWYKNSFTERISMNTAHISIKPSSQYTSGFYSKKITICLSYILHLVWFTKFSNLTYSNR